MKGCTIDENLYPGVTNARERAVRKAELAGLSIVKCSCCGGAATEEHLESRRRDGPVRHQTVVRCLEKVNRCPVEVREEKSTPAHQEGVETVVPQSPGEASGVMKEMNMESKQKERPCECGCGEPAEEDKRFASRGCLGRYARQFRGKKTNGSTRAPDDGDDLSLVYEAMRSLRRLPRPVRRKALELLDSMEESVEF